MSQEDTRLVTVLGTDDPVLLSMAQDVLTEFNIPFMTRADATDVMPNLQLGTRGATSPTYAQLLTEARYADRALELLRELSGASDEPDSAILLRAADSAEDAAKRYMRAAGTAHDPEPDSSLLRPAPHDPDEE